jgi:hypothetical protein
MTSAGVPPSSPFSSAFGAAIGRPPSVLSTHMSPPTPSHPGPSGFHPHPRSPRPSVESTRSHSSASLPRVSSSSSIAKNPPPTLPPTSPLPALPPTPSPISDETLIMFRSSLGSPGHSRRTSGSSFASHRSGASGSRATPNRGRAAADRMSGASFVSSTSDGSSTFSTGMPSHAPSVSTSTFTTLPSNRDSVHSTLSVKSNSSLTVPAWGPGGNKGRHVRASIVEEEDDDDLASIMAKYNDSDDDDDSYGDAASTRHRDSIADIDMRDLPPLTIDDLTVDPPHSAFSTSSSQSPYASSTLSPSSGNPLTSAFQASLTSLGHGSDAGAMSEAAYDAPASSSARLPHSPLSATASAADLQADPIDPYTIHLEMRAHRTKSRTHKHDLLERSQSRHGSRGSSPMPPLSARAEGAGAAAAAVREDGPGPGAGPGRASPDIRTILQRTPRPTRSLTPKSSFSSSSSRSRSKRERERDSAAERRRKSAGRPGTSDTIRPGTSDTITSSTTAPSAKFSPRAAPNGDEAISARSSSSTTNMPSSTASSSTLSSTDFSRVARARAPVADKDEDLESLVGGGPAEGGGYVSVKRSDSGGTFGPRERDDGAGRKRSDSGSVGVGLALMRGARSDESLRSDGSFVSDYGVQIDSALGGEGGKDAGKWESVWMWFGRRLILWVVCAAVDEPEEESRLEREMDGGGSDSDSSIDLHTPLP